MGQFYCIECGRTYNGENITDDFVCKASNCPSGTGMSFIPIENLHLKKFNCIECRTIYDENTVPNDYICKESNCVGNGLTGLIIPIEISEGESNTSNKKYFDYTRECGLCVLLLDSSESMFSDPAFNNYSLPSQYGNKFLNKAELLSKVVANSIFQLTVVNNSEDLYICAIKFDHRQSLIFNDNIKNIVDRHQTAEDFAKYIYDQLNEMKGEKDINSVLTMAHSYIEKFKTGDIPEIGNFAPIFHTQFLDYYNKSVSVPNIRTIIYTYGKQQKEYGAIQSPFSNGNLDLLIGAYFGENSDQGYSSLNEILGNCPLHGDRQLFVINQPQKLVALKLRGLFRMCSATGFCPKCNPNNTKNLLQ